MKGLKRSHRCAELNKANIGETVTVMGWVQKNRNKGGIVFVDLRDRSGILQLIFENGSVSEEDFEKAIKILESCGMKLKESLIEGTSEAALISEKGSSYIELHRQLFANGSKAYGELNAYFADCFESKVSLEVQGSTVYTMEPGLHLFYLFCHAFKHFLHGGFGIRQVCDIIMFAGTYGKEIDWQNQIIILSSRAKSRDLYNEYGKEKTRDNGSCG